MIELRAHTGFNCATRREEDLGQDRILVDGQVVGYVGRKPGAPINLIYPKLPEVTKEEIRRAVIAKYGGEAQRIAEPVELPDEDEEYDEDED